MEFWNLSVFSALPLVVFPRAPLHPHGLSLLLYCLAQARSLYSTIPRRPVPTHTRYTQNTGVFAKTKSSPQIIQIFVVGIRKYALRASRTQKAFFSTLGQCHSFLFFWVVFHLEHLLSSLPALHYHPFSRSSILVIYDKFKTFGVMLPCPPPPSALPYFGLHPIANADSHSFSFTGSSGPRRGVLDSLQ
jgi:hypothetical protein